MTLDGKLTGRHVAALAVLALCVEFWILFSDVHFLWHPEDSSMPRHIVAHVDSVSHRVMIRNPLALAWRAAEDGQALYEGDEIATLDDSQAAITFINSEKLKLGPNSLLRVRRVETVDKPVFKLALLRGSVFQDKPAASGSSATGGEGRFEIEVAGRKVVPGSASGFNIVHTNAGQPIALDDSLLRRDKGGPLVISGSSRIVPTEAAETPALSSPSDGAVFAKPPQIELKWSEPSTPEPLTVEVARDAEFKQVVLKHLADGQTAWTFHPPGKGTFHWRVVASGTKGTSSASVARQFDIVNEIATPKLLRPRIDVEDSSHSGGLAAPKLRKPSIQYQPGTSLWRGAIDLVLSLLIPEARADDQPAAAQAATGASGTFVVPAASGSGANPDSGRPRYSVRLAWSPVGGGRAYTLQISPEPRFTQLVAEKVLTEPNYVWRSNVAGLYYWRVAAIDSAGDRGPFSEYMTFDIKADRNKPGDDTTYETFLRFDEYGAHNNRFTILAGPEYTAYEFNPNGTAVSPNLTHTNAFSVREAQVEFSHRLDNYYSIDVMGKTVLNRITPSNITPSDNQHNLNQNETTLFAGVERRVFEPHYYFTFEGGVRITELDVPVSPGTLTLSTFNFVGFQGLAGWHKPLSHDIELSFKLGPAFMYGDQSIWYGAQTNQAVSWAVTDVFSTGLRFEEELSLFHFAADNLGGNARRERYDSYVFLEFNF